MTGRERGRGIWGPCITIKGEDGEGPTSAGMGVEGPDLAKMGFLPQEPK